MGFPRLEPTAQAERLPILLSCLEGRSQSQQDRYITYSKMLKRFFDIVPWQISYIIAFLVFFVSDEISFVYLTNYGNIVIC